MSSFMRIVVETEEPSATIVDQLRLDAKDPRKGLVTLARLIEKGGAGFGIKLHVAPNCVRASLVGTFTGDPTAADTITINGVAFTARASGAVANEFNITTGANAAPLAAAINASTSNKIKNLIKAEVVSAQVIKIWSLVPGQIGNLFTVSDSLGNFTLAGGATALSGGTEDTDTQLAVGLAEETSA